MPIFTIDPVSERKLGKKSKDKTRPQNKAEPVRNEMRGIVFLIIALVLGVSFYSYHPGDPLFWLKTGDTLSARNLFGTVGANLAGGIFLLIGFSAVWMVGFFLYMAFLSFRTRTQSRPTRSILSFLCLLISFSAIMNLQFQDGVPYKGVEVMSGGLVGLLVSRFMEKFLNYFGAYVLLFSIFVISLILCTRISFGWVFSRIYSWLSGFGRHIKEFHMKSREKRRKKRVRKEHLREEKAKPKRKVTILEPHKEIVKKQEQESFPFMNVAGEFRLPSLDLLNKAPRREPVEILKESLEMNARRLEKKLGDFSVEGEVVEILPGPVITMYEYKPAPGVKISKIAGLSDDLAMGLRAQSIRIVAPIPGKAAIGIEIPNNQREHVYLQEILSSSAYKNSTYRLTMALGKDITGAPFVTDLTKMPHLLVAGATGTGKSVCLNAMINSILFKASPDMVRLLIIDPKRIELSTYRDIPHLLHPVVTEPQEATRALRWAVKEMERRYMLLSDRGVRNIETYNRKTLMDRKTGGKDEPQDTPKSLPYVVLVIDELADLMMVSSREVEEAITRLAQMARAAGIHLIIATQRPSVDVLTGIIKANFPTRISFQVSSKVDSRTILDSIGAENLLGEGDMLFLPPGVARMVRIHGAYISEDEVKRVTDFLRRQMKPDYDPTIISEVARDEEEVEEDIWQDEKYEDAVQLVLKTGQASISMLQRKLRVGYNRSARMIETMEREGIVGPSDGVKPREVYGRRE
jgi:S-DNA-T family DNA segregation ATPase FtsK/SpoIIIE